MFAVLPAIDTGRPIADAYRTMPPAPVGAYRSDEGEVLDRATIVELLRANAILGVVA